jgi:uncharacterized protein (TIGR02996 family)
MWQEFPTWMIERMYNTPLILPEYKQPTDRISEPGATLRLVYADMLEEEGNEEDACYLRKAIQDWYTYIDCLSNSLNPLLQLWLPSKPTRLIVNTAVAWLCRTRHSVVYMTTDGHWKDAQTCKLNERSPEVRLMSLDALKEALCKNPLGGPSTQLLIIQVERPDGHIAMRWNGNYSSVHQGLLYIASV